MNEYRVDLHIHTCLSPCGSLEMSPERIVDTALAQGLDAIAITDHNSTLQCPAIQALGKERGLTVFAGAEVTTREEAHCVALFADDEARAAFQEYLDAHLPPVPNDPERFGDQVWVNSQGEILGEAPYLLISALDQRVEQIAAEEAAMAGPEAPEEQPVRLTPEEELDRNPISIQINGQWQTFPNAAAAEEGQHRRGWL